MQRSIIALSNNCKIALKYISHQHIYNQYLTQNHHKFFDINFLKVMKQAATSFERSFFEYSVPVPMVTIFSEEFVRSNDVRLLLEIATKSSLRMFTDSKTGNLHFICKQRGAQCFDIEAEQHPLQDGYYFSYDYLKIRHRGNCHQGKEAFQYLRIYNLMKLKKKLIEDFMIKLKVDKQSPSLILGKLSNDQEEYFFEKYLNGNIELKRKLRKRFDNIVNIDIKKIGKFQEQEQNLNTKRPAKMSKAKKMRFMKQRAKLAQIKILSKTYNEKEIFDIMQREQNFKNNSKKKIEKQKKTPKYQETSCKTNQYGSLSEYNKQEKQEIYEQSLDLQHKQKVLPEILVLDEQAQYIWSESELDSKDQNQSEVQIITCEDYFKSLRNSALKQSLERQSLNFCFFSRESTKSNKQNI